MALIIVYIPSLFCNKHPSVIAALVADATPGLAIHGKYADKASRGTKQLYFKGPMISHRSFDLIRHVGDKQLILYVPWQPSSCLLLS